MESLMNAGRHWTEHAKLPGVCQRCYGCCQIANSDEGEPWFEWQCLPPGADLAVRMGFVKPIPCPDCNGTGKIPTPAAIEDQEGE